MRKLLSYAIIITLLAIGGYMLYRTIVPNLIARAVVSDSLPGYIPKRLQARVESIRVPLNQGTEAMLKKMHASDIPLEHVLQAVDDISEEEAYAFLDELNAKDPRNTNEVFDILKKHFSTDFDLEVFREPFNHHFEMKQIKNGIAYANFNRNSNDVDIATARAILKKIIIEKEKEVVSNQ